MEHRSSYLDEYKIEGTVNLDGNPCFESEDTFTSFQEKLEEFKQLLVSVVDESKSLTFYKFGDGDYHFLKQNAIGSAAPGRRALSRSYGNIKHEEFVDGCKLCDYYTCEIYPQNRSLFKEVIGRDADYPAEFVYGLTSNGWLTKTFAGQIGIIGAEQKVSLIKSMMEKQEYKEYLGLDSFEDYLHVPQRFACDDIDATEKMIADQLVQSKSKIFLLGFGHVKSALLHRLKKYKDAIFLDVGSSIDALAGIVDHNRPYMGKWINHRVQDFDYSSLDILQYDIWNTPYKMMEN
tara:strand:+ start:2022 stop:2894 length:873 start_codon:yes stop_codon:yes gene_type:complete